MPRPSRTALYANDRTYLWKVIIRTLAILFALVGVGTIAWALSHRMRGPQDNDDIYGGYYSSYGYYLESDHDFATLPWTFITLGLSIVWNITNLVVLFSRNKPVHPGANVGCDLVLWLALIVTGVITGFGASDYLNYYEAGGSTRKGVVIVVGVAMDCVVLLLHFALFISACRYTNARRYGAGSKHAQAITTEATKIAQQMLAEMTGPNGSFRPRTPPQQQQQQQQQFQQTSDVERGVGHNEPPMVEQPSRQLSPRASSAVLPYPLHSPTMQPAAAAENSTLLAGREQPRIRIESPTEPHPAVRSHFSEG